MLGGRARKIQSRKATESRRISAASTPPAARSLLRTVARKGRSWTAQSATAPRAIAVDSVAQWLASHAVRLRTVEARNGFDDWQPLKQLVGAARVVALGEATHGTREFFQLKHRMLEFLVTDYVVHLRHHLAQVGVL